MMSPGNDRSDGRTQDARGSARDAQPFSRRIDCADRPRLDAASRPVRGAGSPVEAARGRVRDAAR